ncbi:GntR family transcriptional regulator [Usitatibacter palustris]|uniref:HTH-type transcriptional repressor RspR n=1 Tax=Usitatibacter palustris TaxID=2732487 RepID=A0A6M4HAC5_9PROT|nr:GntR family transcriptional regulator [Usitatibacter palustris]QJR15344.1 HTH-type transcriptional repressor RspR [Usitatibacter palustris]
MSTRLERTMSGQITAMIRDRILTGAYAPGSPLLQDGIAAEFGVSKIPVREALVQLRAEGLVDIYAHRGFQVRPLVAAEVEEVFRLRMLVEPVAVAEASRRAEAGDREAAARALTVLGDALAGDDLHAVGDLNCAFHLSLIVPRLQPVAADVLLRLHTLSRRYVAVHLMPAGRAKRASKEHKALFAAWAAGKAKEAERLTRAHIEETRQDLEKVLPTP